MKKKIIALMGVAVLAFSMLAGCAEKTEQASDAPVKEQIEEAAETEENQVGMANPWVEITEEEANTLCARLFKAPDGAVVQDWLKCEELGDPSKYLGPMVQLSFELDGLNFTARAQQGAAEDADIAGLYTEWTVGPEDVTLANWGEGHMAGKTYRSVNETGYIDLIEWYDIEIGIKYSLSVAAEDLEGFDIQAVAEQMYTADNEPYTGPSDDAVEEETADGVYGGLLLSSEQSKAGTTDEYGVFYSIVYGSFLNGNVLNLTGTMEYKNSREQDPVFVSEDVVHVFTLTDDTVYRMYGGEDGPDEVTKEEFADYLLDCGDSGLYVDVIVENGVAVEVSIQS